MEPEQLDVSDQAAGNVDAANLRVTRLYDAGWKILNAGPFLNTIGPLLSKSEAASWRYGLMTRECHLNPGGTIHGGFLQATMDHVLSLLAWEAVSRNPCVSVHTDTQFLSAVRAGEFVEAYGVETYRTDGMIFMRGTLAVDDMPVLNAQAIFRILRHPIAPLR